MTDHFFEKPILNSPYEEPRRHWELDKTGQPTQQIIDKRRASELITPIPRAKRQQGREINRRYCWVSPSFRLRHSSMRIRQSSMVFGGWSMNGGGFRIRMIGE